MRKRLLTILLLVTCSIPIFGQTVPSPQEGEVVKISTTLIQVDVTVTGKDGKPVGDLTKDEIEIYENGELQDISNFSFVSSAPAQKAVEKTDSNGVPLPEMTDDVRKIRIARTIALVVDDLTLSFESAHLVRRALQNFVDNQMQDGDLVAIIRTGGGIGALQQFTTNKAQLRAAIEKVRWNAAGTGAIGAFAPLQETEKGDTRLSAVREGVGASGSQGRFDHDDDDTDDLREDYFATGTLGAVNFIVRGMSELPGRKSVMLMSDGFRISRLSTENRTRNTRVVDSLTRLIDLANRSSVVVYTIDSRGLQSGALTAGDDAAELTPSEIGERLSSRTGQLLESQEGLTFLASQTGGLTFRNSNDLSVGIGKMLDDQSYYLVGYQPDAEFFDPDKRRFNQLEVKVKRPDVKVRFRSGFFGISDSDPDSALRGLTDSKKIVAALTSPLAVNELSLSLEAVFREDVKGKLGILSLLHIDLKDLTFTEEKDGSRKGSFDLLAVNFGDNGVPLDTFSKTFSITVKPERYADTIADGIVYSFEVPVKKAGAYQLRVAVVDSSTQKVGSATRFIQVPEIRKNRLVLSGIILDNVSVAEWEREAQTGSAPGSESVSEEGLTASADTALRRFRRGSILKYSLEAYGVAMNSGKEPGILFRTRLIHDGKVIFEGKDSPVMQESIGGSGIPVIVGALVIPAGLEPGDYALQVIVTVKPAKGKPKIASQFVQFEVVN